MTILMPRDRREGARPSRLQEILPWRLRSDWAKQEREGEPRRLESGMCEEAFLAVLDAARAESISAERNKHGGAHTATM